MFVGVKKNYRLNALGVVEIFKTAIATIIRTEYKHFAIITRIRSAVKHAAGRYIFPHPALMKQFFFTK